MLALKHTQTKPESLLILCCLSFSFPNRSTWDEKEVKSVTNMCKCIFRCIWKFCQIPYNGPSYLAQSEYSATDDKVVINGGTPCTVTMWHSPSLAH